jgi:N-acyl-D-aspartate/D-glutamate deacylase
MRTSVLLQLGTTILLAASAAAAPKAIGAQTPPYDLLIQGGVVIDGTGAPRYRADVAIRRMTSLSADQIGQLERGRVSEGTFDDLTVFDAGTGADRATFTDPHQYPVGIHHVLVNGVPVIRGGEHPGATPGRMLRGPARPAATR